MNQKEKKSKRVRLSKAKWFFDLLTGKVNFFVPNKIKLLGNTYDVEMVDELKRNGKNKLGIFSPYTRKIQLKVYPLMPETFMHELIHARNSIFSFPDELNEERIVDLESTYWTQIFMQLYPIAELYKSFKRKSFDSKDKIIKKLKCENQKLKLKIKKLEVKLKCVKK